MLQASGRHAQLAGRCLRRRSARCPRGCRFIATSADIMRGKKLSRTLTTISIDTLAAGDRVLLQPKGRDAFMTKKLELEGSTAMQQGSVKHAEIIGKRSRDTVKSTRGVDIRAYLPTLAEYVAFTPRIVTPVSFLVQLTVALAHLMV